MSAGPSRRTVLRGGLGLASTVGLFGGLGAGGACGRGPQKAPNIVVISIDSWRADRLDDAPRLAQWATEGLRFHTARTNGCWTLPAFLALLYGRYLGGAEASRVQAGAESLGEVLGVYGYHRYTAWGNTALSPHPLAARWFGEGTQRLAHEAAIPEQIRQFPEPFFLWHQVRDLHVSPGPPPRPLEELLKLGAGEDTQQGKERAKRAYAANLAEAEAIVMNLLGALDLTRTVVVLTSLHGEDLFDHGVVGHAGWFWDSVLRVPLVVRGPGIRTGVETQPVQLIDLAPSLLSLVGIRPPMEMEGLDLRELLERPVPLPERPHFAGSHEGAAVIKGGWKFILSRGRCGYAGGSGLPGLEQKALCPLLYGLEKDPAELADRSMQEAARAADLRSNLFAWASARGGLGEADPTKGRGNPQQHQEFVESARRRGYW
jgi:arylsulfatase A-like enzyme